MRLAVVLLLFALPAGAQSSRYKNLNEDEAARVWLDEIVPYIITREERAAFKNLKRSEDRVGFIDLFWRKRDPDPETPENEYKLEHYRRLAYANKFFGVGRPGWKTDRGRIYVLLGPPDAIESDPMGRQAHQFPTEVWIYRDPPHPLLPPYMEISFVDTRLTGDYEITFNLLKDADSTRRTEALMDEDFLDAMSRADVRNSNFGRPGTLGSMGDGRVPELERLSEMQLIAQVPERQLRPLREEITARVSFDTGALAVEKEIDRYRASDGRQSVVVTLRLPYQDFTYTSQANRYESRFDVLARLLLPDGRAADEVNRQEVVAVPKERFEAIRQQSIVYQFQLQAPPGPYELQLAVRDNGSDRIRTATESIVLADPGDDLALSSVVLAERVEKLEVPVARGVTPFSHGEYRVFPSVERVFPTGGTLHVYFETYNLALGEKGVSGLEIEYMFRRDGRLYRKAPATYPFPTDRRDRSVVSAIPLRDFEPGQYSVTVQVTDRVASRTVSAEIPFEVR